jgi:hypothetical protein
VVMCVRVHSYSHLYINGCTVIGVVELFQPFHHW